MAIRRSAEATRQSSLRNVYFGVNVVKFSKMAYSIELHCSMNFAFQAQREVLPPDCRYSGQKATLLPSRGYVAF